MGYRKRDFNGKEFTRVAIFMKPASKVKIAEKKADDLIKGMKEDWKESRTSKGRKLILKKVFVDERYDKGYEVWEWKEPPKRK